MEPAGLLILGILAVAILALAMWNLSADLVFFGALTIIMVLDLVPVHEALSGFSNEGVLTIAALYIVAFAMQETGAIRLIVDSLFGSTSSVRQAQRRIMSPVLLMSSILNNTPIVASFIPAVKEWGEKVDIPSSKLFIPLSYAAILGGTCTLIGTSTNLIVNGLLIENQGVSLNIFSPAWVGIPVAVVGMGYLYVVGDKLLPDRQSGFRSLEDTREYTIEMLVPANSLLAGKSIQEAGLRDLRGLYLVEVIRGSHLMPAVDPSERLEEGDRLVFTGMVDSVGELQRFTGLIPATDQVFKLSTPRHERHLVEAVVSPSNSLNGLTIKEGAFRKKFDAVVLAVSRAGERIKKKVGDIRLQTGDILLLETPRDFTKRFRHSNEFLLVSTLSRNGQPRTGKAKLAWFILGAMVFLAAIGILSMFKASILAAGAMIAARCCSLSEARQSIDWKVLIVIGSALGIGSAIKQTGVAEELVYSMLSWTGGSPFAMLVATYLATWILTELITNNAAAALILPVVFVIVQSIGVDYMPFVMAVIFAASASFSTPIGYQTNLMVMGPGGYRFSDYVKIGLPLNLIVATTAISCILIIWPF
ncbi:MAG: SLC13 family permease [Bacteroidota bacterium]